MENTSDHSNSKFSSRRVPFQQSRSYLTVSHNVYQSTVNHSQSNMRGQMTYGTSDHQSDRSDVIYGTNISSKEVAQILQHFILDYELTKQNQDGQYVSQKIYHTQLSQLDYNQGNVLNVAGSHIKEYNNSLFYQFIYYPAEMISAFDQTIKNLYHRLFITNQTDYATTQLRLAKKELLMCGIKELGKLTYLRDISQKQINRLTSFRGIVIRCSQIFPEMKSALFRCNQCSLQVQVLLQNAKVSEPRQCERCHKKNTLQIDHNLCQFTDKQYVKFQELPEYVPEGQTPNSVTIIAYDNNVDGMRPGDRVQVVGIYRIMPSKTQRNKNTLRSVFSTYLDLISFNVIENQTLKVAGQTKTLFDDNDKNKFAKIADSPTVIKDLVDSFAPSIFGHQEVKKGILTQLFAGTKKNFIAQGRSNFRSDINICLVGDPSTAKSQLLQQVYKISPRGIYTSGRGSSAVGLTANVRKDPQTKQFILQSGALVLSDLGICCIDQFDKMDPQSRTILLEAMEQQTISIAKAGIVCQLNSRTSILAAANPIHSRYDSKKSVVQNINLSPALLSRFDLIYILLDQSNEVYDKKLASHLLNIYSGTQIQKNQLPTHPRQLLTRYITYAKEYVHPVLTEKAGERLIQAYVDMRKLGSNKKIITATTRQLESLIRISQAFAKMRLSKQVKEEDVDEAINLVKVATQQAATDPLTGLIDMDVIVTGKTASSRNRVAKIKQIIKQFVKSNLGKCKNTLTLDFIIPQIEKRWPLTEEKITQKEVIQTLKVLQTESFVVLFGQNRQKPSFKIVKELL